MADQRENGISWTDETWNPVVGCSIVSPACTNCYAMGMAARIERMSGGATHYAGTTKTVNGKPVWTGKLAKAPDHTVTAPLRWKRPRRVFVNSMSDLFHEDMPDDWIDEVFAVMALSPKHTFQILTKRPERMRNYLCDNWAERARLAVEAFTLPVLSTAAGAAQDRLRRYTAPDFPHPLENVWLGVTVEDQARADERIPDLLATPAAVRFVSAEPLLGPIDFRSIKLIETSAYESTVRPVTIDVLSDTSDVPPFLDWIIVGGESGPGARPTHPDWVRSIRDQCAAAGVAFHFKQWGDWAPADPAERRDWFIVDKDGDADLPDGCMPFDLVGEVAMYRSSKARTGRTLDGVIHDAFPGSR